MLTYEKLLVVVMSGGVEFAEAVAAIEEMVDKNEITRKGSGEEVFYYLTPDQHEDGKKAFTV